MIESFQKLYLWLFAAQWIFNAAIAAWVYFDKADKKNAEAVAELAKALTAFTHEQTRRTSVLEERVKHLPTDEEFSAVREDVASMKARVEGMARLVERIEHQTNLIQQHLLTTPNRP